MIFGSHAPVTFGLRSVDNVRAVTYKLHMIEVRQHPDFKAWLDALRDKAAQRKIAQRIVRVQAGLLGDAKFFGGIGELRVDFGPGYRIYFVKRGTEIVILLCGGDKSSQRKDIIRARKLAEEV